MTRPMRSRMLRRPSLWLVLALGVLAVVVAGCATTDDSTISVDTDRISDASRDRLNEALDGVDIDTIQGPPDEGPVGAQGRIGAIGLSSAMALEHLVDLTECQEEDCVASESAAVVGEADGTLRQYMIEFDFVSREGNACQRRLIVAHEEWLEGLLEIGDDLADASVEEARARAQAELDAPGQSLIGAFDCL